MAEKKRAVIVGVNAYDDPKIPPLTGAERDAQEMKDILTQQGDFEIPNGHFLVGKDATRDKVLEAVSDLLWKTERTEVALFYFSGHGFQDGYGSGYLAPSDMDMERPLVRGIDMQWLKDRALRSRNKDAVVLMLDCCYAGIAAEATSGEKGNGVPDALTTAESCFSGMADEGSTRKPGSGVFVFSSSAKSEKSRELSECRHKLRNDEAHHHGAFTFHVLEGLGGLAATDKGGLISLAGLRSHVDAALKASPNQTFKLYASGATNPEGVILARANEFEKLRDALKEVEGKVNSEDWVDWILVADKLSQVVSAHPNYKPVCELTGRHAENLEKCKQRTMAWLFVNKVDLMQRALTCTRRLEKLVAELSLDRICKERAKHDATLGQLLNLVEVAQKNSSWQELQPYLSEPQAGAVPEPQKMGVRRGS